jgi:hypothetical protein
LALTGALGLQASALTAQEGRLRRLLGAALLHVMSGPLPPTLQSSRHCLQQRLVMKPLQQQQLHSRRALAVVVWRMLMSCGRSSLAAAAAARYR